MEDKKISEEEIDATGHLLIAATDRLREQRSEIVGEIVKACARALSLIAISIAGSWSCFTVGRISLDYL